MISLGVTLTSQFLFNQLFVPKYESAGERCGASRIHLTSDPARDSLSSKEQVSLSSTEKRTLMLTMSSTFLPFLRDNGEEFASGTDVDGGAVDATGLTVAALTGTLPITPKIYILSVFAR
jgi:hypothetical protein